MSRGFRRRWSSSATTSTPIRFSGVGGCFANLSVSPGRAGWCLLSSGRYLTPRPVRRRCARHLRAGEPDRRRGRRGRVRAHRHGSACRCAGLPERLCRSPTSRRAHGTGDEPRCGDGVHGRGVCELHPGHGRRVVARSSAGVRRLCGLRHRVGHLERRAVRRACRLSPESRLTNHSRTEQIPRIHSLPGQWRRLVVGRCLEMLGGVPNSVPRTFRNSFWKKFPRIKNTANRLT